MRGLILVRAAALAGVLGILAPARTVAQPPDHKAIQEAVEAFLLHLGDGEFDKVASDLAAKAIVIVVRERDGKWANTYQTGDAWVATMRHLAREGRCYVVGVNPCVHIDQIPESFPHRDRIWDREQHGEWVEEGKAPDRLLASKTDGNGKTILARPLCPYPQVAVWDGKGDTSKAESFACGTR